MGTLINSNYYLCLKYTVDIVPGSLSKLRSQFEKNTVSIKKWYDFTFPSYALPNNATICIPVKLI